MNLKKVNFKEKFKKFSEHWTPKIVAEMNDYEFKLVKIQNDFVWHHHELTDETFIVLEGKMSIEIELETIELLEGEMIVVPRGTKHRPFSEKEAKIMIIEQKETLNTGNTTNELTAPKNDWI